jgi:hypothetical protein
VGDRLGSPSGAAGFYKSQQAPPNNLSIRFAKPELFWRQYFRQRPYCDEYTRSHPNSEVKHRKARSVLGWGTAWEALRVPLAFINHSESDLTFVTRTGLMGKWGAKYENRKVATNFFYNFLSQKKFVATFRFLYFACHLPIKPVAPRLEKIRCDLSIFVSGHRQARTDGK